MKEYLKILHTKPEKELKFKVTDQNEWTENTGSDVAGGEVR